MARAQSPGGWRSGRACRFAGAANAVCPCCYPGLRGRGPGEVADRPADTTAVQGRRLLQRIFGTHKTKEPLPGPLADAVANPQDKDAVGALRLAIRKKLAADPGLRTDVEGMLADGETTTDEGPAPLGELNKSLIGQAAAGVTLVAALIYAAGALTLIFKLWYLQIPWTSVLGQLPHNFIITTAFGQVILPTLLLAALFTALSRRHPNWYEIFRPQRVQRNASKASGTSGTNRWRWLTQLRSRIPYRVVYLLYILWFLSNVALLLFILVWVITERELASSVLQDLWKIYLLSWVCVGLALLAFVYIHRVIYPSKFGDISKQALGMGVFVIALLPTVAAVSAATLLPKVTLCGPSFYTVIDGKPMHKIVGALIGSNSDSIFMAQWQFKLSRCSY
jgi:hypothetical protein